MKSFTKWYEENKEEFNRKRRERYQRDPEYRARVRQQAAKSRQDNPRPRRGRTDGWFEREVDGVTVELARIGQVAIEIGMSQQSIRKWEVAGKIPAPSMDGTHRAYTRRQVELLRQWVQDRDSEALFANWES